MVESVGMRLGLDDLEGEQCVCVDKPETMLAEVASCQRDVHFALHAKHFHTCNAVSLLAIWVVLRELGTPLPLEGREDSSDAAQAHPAVKVDPT